MPRTQKIFLFVLLFFIVTLFATPVRVARDVYSVGSGLNNARTIVRDSGGFLYVVYSGYDGAHYQIYIARSTDDGSTWEPTWATITSTATDNNRASMAIDSFDTLHIVWRGDISTGNDADLMYTRYPNPSITTICTYTGYPGAHCPSLAVGPDNDLHVVYSGCPSGWRIRYLHMNRATYTWDPPEDVGSLTPSRWPSVEVDASNVPHVIYRNNYGGHYRAAHRMKTATGWEGYNGENHDTLDVFAPAGTSLEYSSVFIDSLENIHAIWQFMAAFATNPDTVRYRKYDAGLSSWLLPVEAIFGNGAADAHVNYSGDVVVDNAGDVYVLYHDNDSVFCKVSEDGGATFTIDTVLVNDYQARFPNARGSKFPSFNRVDYPCIDYVYTWADPDSPVVSLMFDRYCIVPVIEETTEVCAHFGEPAESSYTSCEDQNITAYIGCCEWGTMVKITSTDSTVEYFDSTTMSWQNALYLDPTPWGTYWVHLDTDSCNWVWSEYPATSSHGDWFRVLVNSDCETIDTAFIRIQVDNQGTLYGNGTYIDTTHGNPGGGSTGWRTLHEFDLTPYFHGEVDTLEIMGFNAGGIAGMLFELYVICSSPCCGEIDSLSIDFTINGVHYGVTDGEIIWDGDSTLVFTPIPPDTFRDGDTIIACVENAVDTCGGVLDSVVCVEFFVDLSPPVIWDIVPPPDTIITDTLPNISFHLFDSITGVDTSSIVFTVEALPESPTVVWDGASWLVEWTPASAFSRGDTVDICVTVTDTTDYCPDNRLDTCWQIYIKPCVPVDVWVDCPLPCYSFTSCSTQQMIFGINDTTGTGIDTMRVFFDVEIFRGGALFDSYTVSEPSDSLFFTIFGALDSLYATVRGNWADGDSVIINMDSVFTIDGCKTEP